MRRLSMLMLAVTAMLGLGVLAGCGDDGDSGNGPSVIGGENEVDDNCPEEQTCPVGKTRVEDSTVRCGFRCVADIVPDDREADPVCNECQPGELVVPRDDSLCGYICQLPSNEQSEHDMEGGGEGLVCAGACAQGLATRCTCGVEDPCGWKDNGTCNIACAGFEGDTFDDSTDCCDGACITGELNACACSPDDPCGFAADNVCQNIAVECAQYDDALMSENSAEACAAGQYTPCTCGQDDPCGWVGDDYCDDACGQVVENPFDDSADCQ